VSTSYKRLKIVIGGNIKVVQSWSCVLETDCFAPPTFSQLDVWLGGSIVPLVSTWWNATNGPKSLNDTDTNCNSVKAYYYPANSQFSAVQAERTGLTGMVGSAGAHLPTQCSLVMTKLTGKPGRRNRGRMYIPATGVVMVTGHTAGGTYVQGTVNATAALFTAINETTLAGGNPTVSVCSQFETAPATVTQVRGDDELDVQRRRADKIIAQTFYTAAV